MSSLARRQRRQIARRWAMKGVTLDAAQQCVDAVKMNRQQVTEQAVKIAGGAFEKYRKDLKKQLDDDIVPHIQGDMICVFMYVLHEYYGFGAKRLEKAARELWDIVGEMQDTRSDGQVLADTLRDETGLDCKRLFDRLSAEAFAEKTGKIAGENG